MTNAKTIKDGMTKGVWVNYTETISDDTIFTTEPPKNGGDIVCLSPKVQGWETSAENWHCNAAAITTAVNATWCKNLNPAVMPEMYKAMKEMQRLFYAGGSKQEMDEMRILFDNLLKQCKI